MPSDKLPEGEGSKIEISTLEKQSILQKLIGQVKGNLEKLTSSRDTTRELAREAPGANQSHSDTSKFQLAGVQLGLESLRIETERTIAQLQQTPINACSKVTLGAVFTIHEISGNSADKTYFLVSAGGGEIITIGDKNITAITPGTPIARICLRKENGDTIEFQEKEFEIINVI